MSTKRWKTPRHGDRKRLGDKPLHRGPGILPGALICLLLLTVLPALHAAPLQEEVRAADAARIMATIAGDTVRLAPLLGDTLTYGHADGRMQTKAEFLEAVKSNRVKYEAYDYEELHIERMGDDVATMTGCASLRATAGGQRVAFRLRFLAVWRREDGAWRLCAYQSAPLTAPAGR